MNNYYFKLEFPTNKNIVNNLKVDDMNNGMIINTEYNENSENLILEIKTKSIGSINNILDDYFTNYEMILNINDILNKKIIYNINNINNNNK